MNATVNEITIVLESGQPLEVCKQYVEELIEKYGETNDGK